MEKLCRASAPWDKERAGVITHTSSMIDSSLLRKYESMTLELSTAARFMMACALECGDVCVCVCTCA